MDSPYAPITFAVEGDVDIAILAAAAGRLKRLAEALAADFAPHSHVRWRLDDLAAGSAVIALAPESDSPVAIRRVMRGFGDVGAALAADRSLDFSPRTCIAARQLAKLTRRNGVSAVRFESAAGTSRVERLGPTASNPVAPRRALGAVAGLVTSLRRLDELQFTLSDNVFNKAVICHLQGGQEELARSAWNTQVTVSGTVERDPGTGHATHVRQVSSIQQLPDYPRGVWREARGALPWSPGDPPAEAMIRKLRDAI